MATTNANFKVKNGLDAGGDIAASLTLRSNNSSGDEGGEIFLSKAVTNTTLTGGVTIDVFQNKLRFFEQGGSARGFYIDMTTGGASVGTSLTGYTLIASTAFSGTIPSFTSIPQTYRKLVVQIVFTSMGTFSGAVNLTVNSAATTPYTLYLTGSTSAVTSTVGTAIPLSNGTPQVSDLHTVEMPNYYGTHPMMYISGGNSTSQVRWGIASTAAAITQVSFSAGTTWGTAIGNAYLYGVN